MTSLLPRRYKIVPDVAALQRIFREQGIGPVE